MTEMRDVTVADVSVRTFWQLQRHQQDMLREFALIAIDRESGGTQDIPGRLVEIVTDVRTRYASSRDQLIDALEGAARQGLDTVRVTVTLPVSAAASVQATCDAFEEADAYCRAGDLLTLAAPPQVAELRHRLCAEIVQQLTSD